MESLLNIIKILEDLFFSLKIPEEVIFKYNVLKENTFIDLGIKFEPILYHKTNTRRGEEESELSEVQVEIINSLFLILMEQDSSEQQQLLKHIEKLMNSLSKRDKAQLRNSLGYLRKLETKTKSNL